jgi:peptidoglycan/xylan/chitin deacetylase (PgdA/CDA1 family)
MRTQKEQQATQLRENRLMSQEPNQITDHQWNGIPQKVRVLQYHRIRRKDVSDDFTNIAVFDTTFQRQIELLDQWGYVSITFDDYRLFLGGKLNLPKRPVIITFDDAYEEIHSIAFPILKKLGMKAVIFVVGDSSIGASVWDKDNGGEYKLLNTRQILELHMAGFEIGSHSLTHVDLTSIPKEKAWEEIVQSRMQLEILLNSPVRSFACPFGLVNKEVKQMISDAGYTICCGSYSGPPLFGMDYFEIRRIKVFNTNNKFLFRVQLHSLYAFYRWIYWKVKKYIFSRQKQQ